ncbi:MAG: hypothetical protein K9J06_05640 [Flavobacteriales bacterium]|nr:hypothetical protein [Flavobacteriales bacterium]
MMKRNWPIVLLLSAFVFYGSCALLWGERILVNKGLGWDGQVYFWMSRDFFQYVDDHLLTAYHALRIVPSLIVKVMHIITRTEHTYELTPVYFGLLNLASIALGSLLLWNCMKAVRPIWRTVAITAMLASFAFLRMPFYYPILTDSFAFLIGTLLLWGHQRGSTPIKAGAALLGAFTFPSTLILALPLLVLRASDSSAISRRQEVWLTLTGAGIFIILAVTGPAFMGGMPNGTVQPERWTVLLSIPFPLIFLIWVWRGFRGLPHNKELKWILNGRGAVAWGAVMAFVGLIMLWARPSDLPNGFAFVHLVDSGLLHPAVSLVSHVSYFGPIMLVPLILPARFKQEIGDLDLPLRWTAMLGLSMLVASESRTAIVGLPFIILLCARTLDQQTITNRGLLVLSMLALLWSKVWFTMNKGEMEGVLTEFPMQRFFMHIGPWMGTAAYLMQLAAVIATGLLMWRILRPVEEKS